MKQEEKIIANEKKEKKAWSKIKKLIVGILIGLAALIIIGLIVLGIILGPALFELGVQLFGASILSSTEIVDVSMTEEERLEDFASLYEIAVEMNPNKEEFERAYEIDLDRMYLDYQEYIKECENDYDFFCICFMFLRDMPSGHTVMRLPIYEDFVKCGFQMVVDRALQKDENKYLYSWGRVFEEEIKKYDLDNVNFPKFVYVDGEYLASEMSDANNIGARLISINGEKPDDYVRGYLFFSAREYDEIHEKTYRDALYFNDRQGQPVSLLCEREDGEEVTIQLYADSMLETTYNMDFNMKRLDPYYGKDASVNSDATEEKANVTESKNYEIVKDEEHGLVYWRIESCLVSAENDEMMEEIKAALTEYDKLVLDLRYNSGGSESFYSSYVYPVIFKDDDIKHSFSIELKLNEITEKWTKTGVCRLMNNPKIDKEAGIVSYTESMEIGEGNGVKDYQVYVLISQATFSSADIITYNLSQYDNVTLIGENTGGEGMDGAIFVWSMPNSHLPFSFSPGINRSITPSNSVYGTAPDVVCTRSVEAFREQVRIGESGEDPSCYEQRKKWDNVLWEAWKLCEE